MSVRLYDVGNTTLRLSDEDARRRGLLRDEPDDAPPEAPEPDRPADEPQPTEEPSSKKRPAPTARRSR